MASITVDDDLDYPAVWEVHTVQGDNDPDGLIDLGHIIEVGIMHSDYKDRIALVDYDLLRSGRRYR